MSHRVIEAVQASARIDAGARWLAERGRSEEAVVVGASVEGAARVARAAVLRPELAGPEPAGPAPDGAGARASFGWHRFTLPMLAGRLALAPLALEGRAPAAGLALDAVATRAVHDLRAGGGPTPLGRFSAVADRPGLPRALRATADELSRGGLPPDALDESQPDLARLYRAYREALATAGLVDRADVYAAATARAEAGVHPLLALPLLLCDVVASHAVEAAFVRALVARAPASLALVPVGDVRSLGAFVAASGSPVETLADPAPGYALGRVQGRLFGRTGAAADPTGPPAVDESDRSLEISSAPGESRECVEIARRVLAEAESGVPFDRMAVLLRSPAHYRSHVLETFRRAHIPAWMSRGTVRPDPSGRALLALLDCRIDDYSVRSFAEYLSLGVVPPAEQNTDLAWGSDPTFVPPDESVLSYEQPTFREPTDEELLAEASDQARVVAGTLRAPRRWESLLHEASVLGGRARWVHRLAGLAGHLRQQLEDLDDPDHPRSLGIGRQLEDLDALEAFLSPTLDALEALPVVGTWGQHLAALEPLADQTLRDPERVASVLAELSPMAAVGPVSLAEVRQVLALRLTSLVAAPDGRTAGKVFVGAIDEARGLSFDVVFVPGLAEKLFPPKLGEDPMLLDEARATLKRSGDEPGSPWALPVRADRVADERLALRLAVGAAERRLYLSWPRIDVERGRPRVPSFYGLEVLEAAEGTLDGFSTLGFSALTQARSVKGEGGFEDGAMARLGWPAPRDPRDAIDDAEYDLAQLRRFLDAPGGGQHSSHRGAARYLLGANPHLARALRFRGRRWTVRTWHAADGLVRPSGPALEALAAHRLAARPYSATALQRFSACPYQFYLYAIARVTPREVPESMDELDPLSRGLLIHQVQFELYGRLRSEGALPVDSEARLERAFEVLREVLGQVATRYEEDLAPAVERVFREGIEAIHGDLREGLLRGYEKPAGWVPAYFELAFAMPRTAEQDPASTSDPAPLDCGIQLRGSIDLVEQNAGRLRATDYKTGAASVRYRTVIGGGAVLQPVLYALALEKRFPDKTVAMGRLSYCTSRGSFSTREIGLDANARRAAQLVADTIDRSIEHGFLPAAPADRACARCDYRAVCGPYEEQRVGLKKPAPLAPLRELRERP